MITQKCLSELNVRPFKGASADVHARKDYPVTQEPVKIAYWETDRKFYVVQNIGRLLKAKASSTDNTTIDVETIPWSADDPRAMQMTLLELLELPMRASEAEDLLEGWRQHREKALTAKIIANISEWPRPTTYGLIEPLFEAYEAGKLKSAQARTIQKLPHDAQQLLTERKFPYKLNLSPNACSLLLEIFNEHGLDSFKNTIGQPQKLEQLARNRQNIEDKSPKTAHECQALEKTHHPLPADGNANIDIPDVDIAKMNLTKEAKAELEKQLKEEIKNIQDVYDLVNRSWQIMARALANIYRKHLYVARGYNNFGKFCQEELGMNPRYAYKCAQGYITGAIELDKDDIQTSLYRIEKLLSLPGECRDELQNTGYYTLTDGSKILVKDLLDKTIKEGDEKCEKVKADYEYKIKQIVERTTQEKEEMLKKFNEEKTSYDNLCADYQELSKEHDQLKKQVKQINVEIKEKQEVIEEMGLKATEQQAIGAENERKELQKEITKLEAERDLRNSKIKKLEESLSQMTRLHGEAVADIEELKKMTPDQIADMHIKQNVYNFLIAEKWTEEQARTAVEEIGNNYEANKEYVAKRQEEIILEALIANRDETLAYLYHMLFHQIKPAIAFYALKKQQLSMNETSLRYYNALITELEATIKLLKHAHAWWQGNNGSDTNAYHNATTKLIQSNSTCHDLIPHTQLPGEVKKYININK